MDNNFSELQFKYELATGKDYSQIRSLQLNQIIARYNGRKYCKSKAKSWLFSGVFC